MNPNGPFLPGATSLAMMPAAKPSVTVHMMLMRVPAERHDLGRQPKYRARVAAHNGAIPQMVDGFGQSLWLRSGEA